MFSRLEWMIAGRYLRARRKEGAISVVAVFSLLGIFFGVGALIVTMSVMNGFRIELVKQIVGAQPHVQVLNVQRQGEQWEDLGSDVNEDFAQRLESHLRAQSRSKPSKAGQSR